jgi:XTP/dITP diphosphohydrolase
VTAPRVVLATHNQHKVREVTQILEEIFEIPEGAIIGADAVGGPDVVETGLTFAENALLKARALAKHSGLPAIADDSGMCVEALGGAPGVFSARWAGRHGDDAANLKLLLAQMADVPAGRRGAWFECAAALVTPAGDEYVESGKLTGTLTFEPRGEGGFGYDPVLVPTGGSATCAELLPGDKNAISHRGRAFRALAPKIRTVLEG